MDRYINWAYYEIARKSRWFWEQSQIDVTMTGSEAGVSLSVLGNVKEISQVDVITSGQSRKLTEMDDDVFFNTWLPHGDELWSDASLRSEPSQYYLFDETLYFLPPPRSTRKYRVYYYSYVKPLVADSDKPITPADLDEAITLGAAKRCHIRVNEPSQAVARERDLSVVYDDMHTDETMKDLGHQDRVEPDDTWL